MDAEYKQNFHWKKILLIVIVSILSYFLPLPISPEAMIVFSILVLSALLWVTEAMPLFMTSLIATILIVLFNIFSFEEAVIKFVDPILILLFGGFLIAQAMQNVGWDKRIAIQISHRVKDDRFALLALMFVTAFLSMWISNTATTIVMIPIALGILHKFKKEMNNFAKAAVLGIAYSANIGGVGTILGSPPNAIVVANLLEFSNITITFLDWIIAALPLVIILIPIAWILLMKIFPFEKADIIDDMEIGKRTGSQKVFLAVFIGTVLLWTTTPFTGLSSSLIAMMSATVLFLIGLLKLGDLNKTNYQILLLFGGGLVLGGAIFSTGLSDFFAQSLANALMGNPDFLVILVVIAFSIALGALASNTATAAILVPVMIPLSGMLGLPVTSLSMMAGIAVSFDFLLPVGTPPNAIAYATGKVSVRDMLKAGIVLTIISIIVLALVAQFLWA
ncbi:DASS family sodium-coupled anion symporter [Candidatus Micrarchaeota archaeon]|nr:DASS family sodium-coupled anion symporter [Candidatus Micrarchaeota archaeon]MBU1930898.1 DASS family sodium-coupled anion symporter [Candidatus Micrarchaeota archaeon]